MLYACIHETRRPLHSRPARPGRLDHWKILEKKILRGPEWSALRKKLTQHSTMMIDDDDRFMALNDVFWYYVCMIPTRRQQHRRKRFSRRDRHTWQLNFEGFRWQQVLSIQRCLPDDYAIYLNCSDSSKLHSQRWSQLRKVEKATTVP